MKQGDAIRVDSSSSRCRRQVCKCGCFNRGDVTSSERDDRLGSLEVSAVAVIGNLRSSVRLRTSRTDRVGTAERRRVRSKGQWNRQRKRVARVSEQSPLTMCTGNGLTDVEASDSVHNVERAAGLKHQHKAVFGR